MAGTHANGYDVALVLSDAQLTRSVATAFLQRFSRDGLPGEAQFDVPTGLPDGQGGTITGRLHARLDLPLARLTPRRTVVDTQTLPQPEAPADAMEIRIPFRQSALVFPPPVPPAFERRNLRGDLSLIVFFGYPGNGAANFGLDASRTLVWLRFANDDPDPAPNGPTSRGKMVSLYALVGRTWNAAEQLELERRIAEGLRANGNADLTNFDLGVSAAACPVPPAQAPAAQVRLEPPSTPLCVDFETFSRANDPRSYLALKLKLAQRSLAAGVTPGALGRGWMRNTEDAAILIDDTFLLQDLLPPALMRALLGDALNGLDDDAELELAEEHFAAPLALTTPIPKRLDLPLSPDDSDRPNARIESIQVAIVADPSSPGNRMVQVTAGAGGGVDPLYTFTATLRINVRFGVNAGEPDLDMEVDENRSIDVTALGLFVIPAGLGALILAVLGPFIGGLIVVTTILPLLLAAFLADLAIDAIAWAVLPGAVGGQLTGGGAGTDVDIIPFGFTGAAFDDLVYRGILLIAEEDTITYTGFTPTSAAQWRLNVDRQRLELPRIASASDTMVRDAFTGVTEAAADVAGGGGDVRALNGSALHDFGRLQLWRARSITQADLRAATYNRQQITFSPLNPSNPADTLRLQRTALINPQSLDPRDAEVHAVGLRTDQGRFALLIVWETSLLRRRCFYRRYNQSLPGAELLLVGPPRRVGERGDCVEVRENTRGFDVPISVEDLLQPSPIGPGSGGGTISVQVGYRELECVTAATLAARPILLVPPVVVAWVVITTDGVRHAVAPGAPIGIELPAPGTPGEPILRPGLPMRRQNIVTFELVGQDNRECRFRTTRGASGSFTAEATFTEANGTAHTAQRAVKFIGVQVESVGFGRVAQLLDDLERGIRDPATFPDLGIPIGDLPSPGGGRPPTPERDRPATPDRAGSGPRQASGAARRSRSTARVRRALNRRQPASVLEDASLAERGAKATLVGRVQAHVRALPAAARRHAGVKRYAEKIAALVASLPEPPEQRD